jgi:hypothetical protein
MKVINPANTRGMALAYMLPGFVILQGVVRSVRLNDDDGLVTVETYGADVIRDRPGTLVTVFAHLSSDTLDMIQFGELRNEELI